MDHWANPDCSNPIIYTDNGNATIRLKIGMPSRVYIRAQQGDILWAGGYLTSVSYTASWQNNRTINFYDGNSKKELNFNLTNIPYGKQHIQVSASCVVLLFDNGFSSTYPVPQSGAHSLDFNVAPTPTPTPISTPVTTASKPVSTLEIMAIALTIAVVIGISVGLLIYSRKHRR